MSARPFCREETKLQLEKKRAVAADIVPVRRDRVVQHGTAHVIKIIVFAVPLLPPAGQATMSGIL